LWFFVSGLTIVMGEKKANPFEFNPVMADVIESNQLATGEKEKNILTAAYDIISAIERTGSLPT
jgi:hypothetical protein